MSRSFDLRAIKTLAAAALTAIVIIVFMLPLLASRIDRQARHREGEFVAASFAREVDILRNQIGSAANWDPAIIHLDRHFDAAWAQSELTATNDRDVGSRIVIVLDAGNTVLFAREHGRTMQAGRAELVRLAAGDIVATIRTLEAARDAAAARHAPDAEQKPASWIDGSAVVLVSGRPFLVVASLVGSDSGKLALTHRRAPISLLISDLQATIMPQVGRRLQLVGAELTAALPAGTRASFPLRDGRGEVMAVFSWQPARPGTMLLDAALPPILIVIVALLGAVLLAYRQGVQGTRILMDAEAQARHLSLHDGITGLPNRRSLSRLLDQALAQRAGAGDEVAILLFDIDHFKSINVTFGNVVGDELIQLVGSRLQQLCESGQICGRFGGDEFLFILSGDAACAGPEAAGEFARRVLACFGTPISLSGNMIQASACIGISVAKAGSVGASDLLCQADLALCKAKAAGGGVEQLFDSEMEQARGRRRALEQDLRQALRDGAIGVAYQPQFDRDRMVGVEALARWTHKDLGPISPAVFAPLAEDCGLIGILGMQVLRHAFNDSRRWPDLRVAINVSARQLEMPDFVASVHDLVVEMQVDPSRFELEITEGVLVANNQEMQTTLQSLHGMGFTIAIDDFGTGYSSLSYLQRFPVDKIKIDRSFVCKLPDDRQSFLIICAIVHLAQALDMAVIAEGVETEAQQQMLIRAGCTRTQGFFKGRPMAAELIAHLASPAAMSAAAEARSAA